MLYPSPVTVEESILLVEDERPLLEYLSALLTRDYRILTAENAVEAEAVLASQSVAVILCDHRLPGEYGLDFLRRIRRGHPRTQAILLTGHAEAQECSAAIAAGVILQALVKPASLTEIRAAVDHALGVHARCPMPPRVDVVETKRLSTTTPAAEGKILEANTRPKEERNRRGWLPRQAMRPRLLVKLGVLAILTLYWVKSAALGDFIDRAIFHDFLPF